jgi:hypothetical protein
MNVYPEVTIVFMEILDAGFQQYSLLAVACTCTAQHQLSVVISGRTY